MRHIGTSNFLPPHLERIIEATGVVPVLDQLQINPRYLQAEARDYNDSHAIVTQSWSPLGQGNDLLAEPLLVELAEVYGCTPGQLVIAWHLALGLCTIPKSSDPQRLRDNLAAAQIDLSPDDVARISGLDGTETDVKHPDAFWH